MPEADSSFVVDREDVDALVDAGAEQVEAEVARPEAAGEDGLGLRVHLVQFLGADLAEAPVVGDGVLALAARDDLVEPLDAVDAIAELLRDRADALAPAGLVEGIRLEAR